MFCLVAVQRNLYGSGLRKHTFGPLGGTYPSHFKLSLSALSSPTLNTFLTRNSTKLYLIAKPQDKTLRDEDRH
jgi:hypothetical protein